MQFNIAWLLCLILAACSDAAPPAADMAVADGATADSTSDTFRDTSDDQSFDAAVPKRILLFTKTAGFRHGSIADGVQAITTAATTLGWAVDQTEDAGAFIDSNLARYGAVVWLNTSGDVLDDIQQQAFQRYIQAGGGYVGVHAASDTEYGWSWYGQLVGSYFANHPQIQSADVLVDAAAHPATAHLSGPWNRIDEWYNFQSNPRANVTVLLSLDEASYAGGTMGDHPIAWAHTFDGGRAFYTAMGHTAASYQEPDFVNHLIGGIRWAAGWP